jgi:glycosyltransferase involved in cell wall biosynthesis
MKHILICELSLNGHHGIYLERICSAYLKMGYYVTITLHHHCQHYSFLNNLIKKYDNKVKLKVISDLDLKSKLRNYGSNLGAELANWILFRRIFNEINSEKRVNYVFIPLLDYFINGFGLFGTPFDSTPWGGIYMQASLHHFNYKSLKSNKRFNIIKLFLFYKLLKNKFLVKIFVIDELLFKFTSENFFNLNDRLQYLADPAEFVGDHTYASAREVLNIPAGSSVILVYGQINARKGLNTLIKAFDHPEVPKSLQIIIVGKQDTSIEDFFKSKKIRELIENHRIVLINTFVNDTTQQMVFSAADIVWLGYENHFSMSGVLVLAATAKKVVLSTNKGLIGWYTQEKCLGISVNTNDISEVRRALVDLCDDSLRRSYQANIAPDFKQHTWEVAIQKILLASKHILNNDM